MALLGRRAKIDVFDEYGLTMFFVGCRSGHVGVVRLLMDCTSISMVDNQMGHSALSLSLEGGFIEMARLLLR